VNAAMKGRLLIVDDEVAQMRALCDTLGSEGYLTRGFSSGREALDALCPGAFDLLLTDLMMPEMDGLSLIAATQRIDPALGAIVMTGHGTIDTAVQALQGGAFDYILKPFKLNVILAVLARALDLQRLRRENAALQALEKRRSEELAAAYQDLESFSYSISHDLRAPLRTVDGFAQILEEEHAELLGEEGRRKLRIIRDGSRRMDEMIVGLLSFSHASRQPLHLARVDMIAMVRTVVAESLLAHVGPQAHIEIGDLPPAPGDPTVIRQVWTNLVGNALKYSAKRTEPRIGIRGSVQGAEAVYEVEDNGAGFDMQHADKLFGVFQRLHNVEEFPGTGVGLAIVQRIVARHGGRVWARGVPDAGACLSFTLPVGTTPMNPFPPGGNSPP
jgi:signal transduction histidine kinase